DSCRERLERVPLILKRFRQSVLAAAMTGKLTEDWRETDSTVASAQSLANALKQAHIAAGGHKRGNAAAPTDGVHALMKSMFPAEWELVELRDLVSPDRPITYGILKPGPDQADGVPYVRVADYPKNCLQTTGLRRTSKAIDEEFSRSRLRAGDLLLSIRGTVGRVIEVPEELTGGNITQDSARLSLQPLVERQYVRFYLSCELAQSRMQLAVKGVAVRGINIGDVRALQIPLPPLEEQREIVRRVKGLLDLADSIERRCEVPLRAVSQLGGSILAKAFRGELVPQDPSDEPASELLKRIRTEDLDKSPKKAARKEKALAR
ncbi:MAG TPA: restriction endonuclease subunit S, partial [Candidatus Obscuribacterales bacterium]